MRATLLAATVATAILMVGCGEEGAGQGSSPESEAEPGPSRAKQAQPKKPETVKGEVTRKPSQEQQKSEPNPEPASRNIPGLTPQDIYLNLENRGFKCSEPEGAFYALPNVRGCLNKGLKTSGEFAQRLLEEEQVVVTDGAGFGAEGYVRISYATSMQQIEEGVKRIKRFAEKLQ